MNHRYNRGWHPHHHNRCNNNNPGGRILFGLIIALLGVAFLLKTMGIFPFYFRFSWPVILIVVGALIGAKNGFRNNAWWILIAIGVAHLIPTFHIFGKPSRAFVWPLIVIVAGIMIAFRPRRHRYIPETVGGAVVSSDDTLMIDVTFGGRKELVTSKDFKGGTVNVAFGGSEINLTQADFTSPSIVIDCRVAFGAVELVLPGNWDLQNEIRPSFGSIEDQRVIHASVAGEVRKKLILTGSCSFSSIDVKSY